MGILGVYPPTDQKLNADNLTVQCNECGERKIITVEFYMRIELPPYCSCGNTDWLLVFRKG